MTLCVIDGKQCECQPQDGVWCPPAGELKRELAQLQSKLEVEEAVSNRLRISWREDTDELQSKLAEADQKYSHFAELANAEHERQVERIAGLEGKLADAGRENEMHAVVIAEWQKDCLGFQAELKTERENGAKWLADAKRYAQNADFWRGRYEGK